MKLSEIKIGMKIRDENGALYVLEHCDEGNDQEPSVLYFVEYKDGEVWSEIYVYDCEFIEDFNDGAYTIE